MKNKKKKEVIYESLKGNLNPQSRAERIRILLKKNSKVFRDKQAMTEFKEPILMLERRSRAVEFYENATKGEFNFKHSDGKNRTLYLEPSMLKSFDYGKRKFRGYYCHEDFPLPLPENPLVVADTINMIIEKSMMDLKKLNERTEEIKAKTIKMLLIALLIGVFVYMAYNGHWVEGILDKFLGTSLTPKPIINGTLQTMSGG